MATSFDDIENLALIEIRDYKLDNLYNTDPTAFYQYLDGFLLKAISEFTTSCLQDLTYDATSRQFTNSTLTFLEQNILANFTVMMWFMAETQNITQFNLHLQDKEFKVYSEAENLKQKSEYLDKMREKAYQLSQDYSLQNISKIPYYSNMNII